MFICRIPWEFRSLNLLEPSGPHRACYGTALPFFILRIYRREDEEEEVSSYRMTFNKREDIGN
jgi:hypothetical protein